MNNFQKNKRMIKMPFLISVNEMDSFAQKCKLYYLARSEASTITRTWSTLDTYLSLLKHLIGRERHWLGRKHQSWLDHGLHSALTCAAWTIQLLYMYVQLNIWMAAKNSLHKSEMRKVSTKWPKCNHKVVFFFY